MKKNNIFFVIIAVIVVFLFSKFMWWSNLVSIFLSVSLLILFFLWKTKWKLKIWSIVLWLILLSTDFFIILLLIIPSNSYSLSTKQYYQKKSNYMKIYLKDDKKILDWMAILIKRNGRWTPFKLNEYEKWRKIILKKNDKIWFMWRKDVKSYAVIYLWDDTILRITPWTKLNLTKVVKNLKDLSSSKTEIDLENWNIWFRVLKLVKNSSNMKINTWTWQTLIIRWTAWLVSKKWNITTVVDYSHFIEVKNNKESKLLNPNEWAIIKNDKISITDKIKSILKYAWISKKQVEQFKLLDNKDIKKMKEEIISYIKSQAWTLRWYKLFRTLESIKYKIFSIWDNNYKEKLNNLINYKYLIWETDKFTSSLLKDPNLVFIASNLQKQKAKVWYLYEEYKNNIKDSDVYKTYIINMGIEKKVSNINWFINSSLKNIKWQYDDLMKEINR